MTLDIAELLVSKINYNEQTGQMLNHRSSESELRMLAARAADKAYSPAGTQRHCQDASLLDNSYAVMYHKLRVAACATGNYDLCHLLSPVL